MKSIFAIAAAAAVLAVLPACQSTAPDTTLNGRLKSEYGWKGTEQMPGGVKGYESPTTRQRVEAEALAKAEAERAAREKTAAAKPAEKPAAVSAAKPAEKPAAVPAAKPAEKPAAVPAVKPAEKPAAVPAVKPLKENKSDKIYTVQEGDSLYTIAKREYKNALRWDLIFEANKELLKNNPNHIRPGMKLKIPAFQNR